MASLLQYFSGVGSPPYSSVFHIYLGGFVAVHQPRFDRESDMGGFRLSLMDETPGIPLGTRAGETSKSDDALECI